MKFSKEVQYRIVLSFIFGLMGFVISLSFVNSFNLYDFPITIFPGFYFPLLLSINWGWKYGILASAIGIVPSMILLLQSQGYGIIYVIFVFIFWIIYHGFFEGLLRNGSIKKWYYNIYFTEIIFRIFTAIGYYIIFRWLLTFSSNVDHVYFTDKWIMLTVVSETIGALLILLIAKFSIRINFVREIFKSKDKELHKIVYYSIISFCIFWIMDAYIKTYSSSSFSRDFLDNLVLDVDIHNWLSRITVFILMLIISIMYSGFISKLNNSKSEVEVQYNNMKSILRLTNDMKNASSIDPLQFMTNLLNTALSIIPEATFGGSYMVDGEYLIPVSTTDNKNINPDKLKIKYSDLFGNKFAEKVFVLEDYKDRLLNTDSVDPRIKNVISQLNQQETLFICISEDNVKVACIFLSIDENSGKHFSNESIELAKLLESIPSTFYSTFKGYQNKQKIYEDMISSIVKILSIHNPYTNEHSENVAKLSVMIAKKMDMSTEDIDRVYWSALLHDIGKIIIPEEILDKQNKLSSEEYEFIKMHPVWGYETLDSSDSLANIAQNVLHHHERWDGGGYPDGLTEKEIPLISRIITVADSYDAMTSDRPYRNALSKEIALNEVITNSGKQFDPNIVDIFNSLI